MVDSWPIAGVESFPEAELVFQLCLVGRQSKNNLFSACLTPHSQAVARLTEFWEIHIASRECP